MAQPYSTPTDVLNQVLTQLCTDAQWDLSADIILRIAEGDRKINSKLSGLGYLLPFTSNPPMIFDLSVNYARYACFRDLFAAGSPSAGDSAEKKFKDAFDESVKELEDGVASLLDSSGNVIASSKFGVAVAQNTAPVDNKAGQLISSYIDDVDENDGLTPAENSDAD